MIRDDNELDQVVGNTNNAYSQPDPKQKISSATCMFTRRVPV